VSKSQQNLSKPRNSCSSSINLHDNTSSDSNSDPDSSEDSDSDLDLVTISNSSHRILDISYLNSALMSSVACAFCNERGTVEINLQ